MIGEARQKDDWRNGAAAGAWTGLFFGRALSGERGMGIRPWIRAAPGALYSSLLVIGLEHLIYLTFKEQPTLEKAIEENQDSPSFSTADWWPRWMPAHPDTLRRISELTDRLHDLKEEVKDLSSNK
jgi:hypothetical protein